MCRVTPRANACTSQGSMLPCVGVCTYCVENPWQHMATPCAGDWLKFGYVDTDAQRVLTALGIAGVLGHGLIAAYAAWHAQRRDESVPVAVLRGFFVGTPELLRCYYEEQEEP